MKKISSEASESLYTIIEARQSIKSFIITSNRAIVDWGSVFPDQVIANTILDRIAQNVYRITIKGESYRCNFRPKIKIA